MSILSVRAGPSGKRQAPVSALGTSTWNAATPLVLEVAKVGHTPGIYQFTICIFPIVAAGSGTLSIVVNYDAPNFGPTSITYQAAGVLNNGFIAPRHLMSSGRAPIVMTLTTAAVTGSPRFYVNCPGDFIVATFPTDYPS